jgi:hypothetical protein
MNLRGKTREQLHAALEHKSRSELIDLIHSLLTVEQLLKPSEIAARSCLNKRAVLRDIRDGKFGDCYANQSHCLVLVFMGWLRNAYVIVRANETG